MTGGSGGFATVSSLNLVGKSSLTKLSTVENVYFAQVVEGLARNIMDFPARTWEDLKRVDRLLRPPTALMTEDEKHDGAIIVSQFLKLLYSLQGMF